jgi:predicted nucleic acid-binding protein
VVDASVAVKWFVSEVHTEKAERLLDGSWVLLAPDLLYAEVTNILWKRVRGGLMDSEEARVALETLLVFPLRVFPSSPLSLAALEIAVQTDRTAYDSPYVALAVREGAPLVTADQRLYSALSSGPLAPNLVWVGDLPG